MKPSSPAPGPTSYTSVIGVDSNAFLGTDAWGSPAVAATPAVAIGGGGFFGWWPQRASAPAPDQGSAMAACPGFQRGKPVNQGRRRPVLTAPVLTGQSLQLAAQGFDLPGAGRRRVERALPTSSTSAPTKGSAHAYAEIEKTIA
jgi:hypothetical protein